MINGITEEQQRALALCYPKGLPFKEDIAVLVGGSGIDVAFAQAGIAITIAKPSLLWRGLMLAEQQAGIRVDIHEQICYGNLGAMIDCSRNAVLKPSAFKQLVIMLAKMGYTVIQLYIEDTFVLSEYPYFGYRRGGYTSAELRDMDAFAAMFGIELVPAVQTLAHLGQTLKWDAFGDVLDIGDILLADEDKTYALIEAIFKTLCACFTSKRINIGMDEAHMVGLGKYLDKHGYCPRMELMLRHFTRVHDLAVKYGLEPMLWSDMFFRLASGGDYYAPDCVIDPEIKKTIPTDTSLVYWDYYSQNKETYDRMFESHAKMSDNIIFAGGAWKWTGFSPSNAFSMEIARLAHESCKEHGINEVLITAWGDNGAECSLFAVLPSLQYWAELCYGNAQDESMESRFQLCTGGSLEEFLLMDTPMFTPNNPSPGRCSVNAPKYILYQDILEGLFDAHIQAESYSRHFADCAKAMAGKGGAWKALFDVQASLCDLLSLKCRAGIDIRAAYKGNNREILLKYETELLPEIVKRIHSFAALYRVQWKAENKIQGLDVFDLKIGGLIRRTQSAAERLGEYLSGAVDALPELETEVLPYRTKTDDIDIHSPMWHNIVSASTIALI